MPSKDLPIIGVPILERTHLERASEHIELVIDDVMASLPKPEQLSAHERRGIIARYTAVLEGNFIYWMTATYLSASSAEAHEIIKDNLLQEVRDNHPGMLRRFAVAARANPTDVDRMAIHQELQAVRAFVARLATLQLMLMMAFFEGFIQRFMPYLADLAARQGSRETEYTDVHSVVDVAHTQELLTAFGSELDLEKDPVSSATLYEGVEVLRSLIRTIICS
jgi:hypothetical protein